MLITAIVVNATATAMKTPVGPNPAGWDSAQASGISQSHRQTMLTSVGVRVSPAPLNAAIMT